MIEELLKVVLDLLRSVLFTCQIPQNFKVEMTRFVDEGRKIRVFQKADIELTISAEADKAAFCAGPLS